MYFFSWVTKIQPRGIHVAVSKGGRKGNLDLTPKSNVAASLRNAEFYPNESELMGKTCDPNFGSFGSPETNGLSSFEDYVQRQGAQPHTTPVISEF
jgi:hypothetical protein